MVNLFSTSDMAAGYATARPPVHREIFARVKRHLRPGYRRALDIGCGAGLSTAILRGFAEHLIGLEHVETMVQLASRMTPDGRFVAGSAEALPFSNDSADLITAAGSLNYVDVEAFLLEGERVLSAEGALVVYDFGQGRRFADDDPALDVWFKEFEKHHPAPAGAARPLDPDTLRQLGAKFRVVAAESFGVTIEMSRSKYVDYVMTETNVSAAVRKGVGSGAVRTWCEDTLARVWPGEETAPRAVLFPSYYICFAHAGDGSRIIST